MFEAASARPSVSSLPSTVLFDFPGGIEMPIKSISMFAVVSELDAALDSTRHTVLDGHPLC